MGEGMAGLEDELEDDYDTDDTGSGTPETFSAELLEETLETLKPKKPFCVDVDDLLDKVIEGMAARNQGCVLVRNGEVLAGIFTERDLLRKVVGKIDPKKTKVGDVMTPNPEAVSFHDTIAAVLNKMSVGGFRHVPLVDIKHRPVGILSVKELVNYFVEHFPSRVLNVAPDPATRRPDEIGGAG
jgi:CBS domain-containing protein